MNFVIELISKFISSILMMAVTIYIWHYLLDKKMSFKSIKNIFVIISLSIVSIINYYNINQFIRIVSITLILMLFFRILFKENLKRCIITPIISQMIIMISEVIFALIISFCFKLNGDQIIATQFGQFFSNCAISIIVLLISKIWFVKKIYLFFIKTTDKISKNQLLVFTTILLVIANFLTMLLYYRVEFRYLLIFNTCLTLFCLFIIVNSFINKNNYIKVYDKYNTTLNSLKEYEDILDKYRISNHENKNQLLTIRNMIPKTNKKTINFIDTIIENKLKDDDVTMIEASKIPAGGLRGLIYSKVLTIKSLNINYNLQLSKDIKAVDLIKLDDSLMLDICHVIGVYIDNAIQAVKDLKKKHINLQMYLEDKFLIISVSNNYEGVLNIDKMDIKGYTTKGKDRGYGLVLAKEIIDNNKNLHNEKGITKDIFTQTLKIKM